ncbi:10439_t:CDS:2 [Diversispora eburnea]|uniref:10439_t:CDS:1 n=1 Tax=Diversispora eburnea TaxID=1213867 RepID=A0A9N9C5N8_9GLOM|nr:10439_t:CDS:2 [Diversispora eburnea]
MKLIGERKIFSMGKLFKRSSSKIHSEDLQAQQPESAGAASNSSSKNFLRRFKLKKFKIGRNINLSPNTNDIEGESDINLNNFSQETSIEPTLIIDTTLITGTTPKFLLSSFGDSEVNINIFSNVNNTEEKSEVNSNTLTQEATSIKPTSITEGKSVINDINLEQKESPIKPSLIIDAKFVLSIFGDSEVNRKTNILSNINYSEVKNLLTQDERCCELKSKIEKSSVLKLARINYFEDSKLQNTTYRINDSSNPDLCSNITINQIFDSSSRLENHYSNFISSVETFNIGADFPKYVDCICEATNKEGRTAAHRNRIGRIAL